MATTAVELAQPQPQPSEGAARRLIGALGRAPLNVVLLVRTADDCLVLNGGGSCG